MVNERWAPIPNYEGVYEISDGGKVRSLPRRRFNGSGWFTDAGRVLKPVWAGAGYEQVCLYAADGKMRRRYIHALVLETFVGPRPPRTLTRHLDGDPSNNSLHNLAWGTPRENSIDTIAHGRNRKAAKTHCNYGHILMAPNLANISARGRKCKACNRARGNLHTHPDWDMQEVSDRHFSEIMRGT